MLVSTPLGRLQIITPLVGRRAAYAVLAAVSAGIACGVPLVAIVAGIEAVDIVPGRCEVIDEGQPFCVMVRAGGCGWGVGGWGVGEVELGGVGWVRGEEAVRAGGRHSDRSLGL